MTQLQPLPSFLSQTSSQLFNSVYLFHISFNFPSLFYPVPLFSVIFTVGSLSALIRAVYSLHCMSWYPSFLVFTDLVLYCFNLFYIFFSFPLLHFLTFDLSYPQSTNCISCLLPCSSSLSSLWSGCSPHSFLTSSLLFLSSLQSFHSLKMIQEASSFSDLLLCLTQLLSAYLTDHHNDRSSKHL